MKIKSNLALLLLMSALSLLISQSALAVTNTGRITTFHLNSDVAGRDACVRMTPNLTAFDGWACVFNNNPLRSQLTTLMREAYERSRPCDIA